MSKVIFGPDGHPLVVAGEPSTELTKAVAHEVVDGEVAKRVRHRATTLSTVWDGKRGKPKPTPVTYDTLRMMSHRSEWVRAIIKTRKNQIGRIPWAIQPKDEDDDSPSTKKLCEELEALLRRPSMRGSRPHARSWRQFIGEVLEDVLVLDAGCIEKERDGRGWIVALYPVDGATIRPNLDEFGGFEDDAYVQVIDGQVTARFGMEDLVYIMDNPLTDIRFSGYGYSPLESLIISVTAELYASKYNSSYFEKGAVPEGLLNLGEDVSPEDVDAFRLYWMNEIMGKPWALPIIGGKGVEWVQWRDSNRDMQFMEYQQWLLKKTCAVYQIPPQEVGELEDVNRSTAEDQDDVNQSKSIEPILSLLKDYIDVEIIGEYGQGVGDYVEFAWQNEGDNIAEVITKYQAAIPMGAATRAEFREELGMDPGEHEGLHLYLTDGQPQPLPTQEDVQQMGAAAEAKREQEAQQQQLKQQQEEGMGSPMPWQPARDDDDGVADAQDMHRQANAGATGALNRVGKTVAKVRPGGIDRNPALSERQDALNDLFEEKRANLLSDLSGILGVDLAEVEELVDR